MKIYYEPVNLKQWNMFEKVKHIGHIEPFLATKSIEVGDVILLHVGAQDKSYESGIYAVEEIVKVLIFWKTVLKITAIIKTQLM